MEKIKIVCRALIVGEQGVLLVKKTNSDFWSMPGGKLDSDDESLQECLIREIKEELGVDSLLDGDIYSVIELHKNDTRSIELVWKVTLQEDPMRLQKNIYEISEGELSEIHWFNKNDMQTMNIKPEFLKQVL